MAWREIPEDKPLQPGDIVRLTFSAWGPMFLKATEAAMIEASLANKEGYRLMNIDYLTPGKMIFKFRIVKTNPVVITCLAIAGVVMIIGGVAGYVLESTEQLFETPVAAVASVGLVIVAGIVLLSVLRK